jgi:hypothetical protein
MSGIEALTGHWRHGRSLIRAEAVIEKGLPARLRNVSKRISVDLKKQPKKRSKMRYGATTAPRFGPRVGTSSLLTLYPVIGAIVAATHRYWSHLHMLRAWGSSLLAPILWPTGPLGVNLHIH